MDVSDKQRFLVETISVRERAEALVQELVHAQAECERQLRLMNRPDNIKALTGKSSIERAIDETRRTIAMLERTIQDARAELARDGEVGEGELGRLAAAVHVASTFRTRLEGAA
jgi:hypothetical protein